MKKRTTIKKTIMIKTTTRKTVKTTLMNKTAINMTVMKTTVMKLMVIGINGKDTNGGCCCHWKALMTSDANDRRHQRGKWHGPKCQ